MRKRLRKREKFEIQNLKYTLENMIEEIEKLKDEKAVLVENISILEKEKEEVEEELSRKNNPCVKKIREKLGV